MAVTVLITGAGRGIGRELALQCHSRGDNVIGTIRSPDRPSDIPDDIRLEQLDVKDPESAGALAALLDGVRIDALVCNAGVFPARGGMREADYTSEEWVSGFMTNVAGPFNTIRALLPNLAMSDNARIAVISSAMGSSASAAGGSYIYRASKAAATNLAMNLAVELAPAGISIGAFHPGWVRTDMGTEAAPVDLCNSATGILERIEALNPETTGVFEDYLGQDVPF